MGPSSSFYASFDILLFLFLLIISVLFSFDQLPVYSHHGGLASGDLSIRGRSSALPLLVGPFFGREGGFPLFPLELLSWGGAQRGRSGLLA